MQLKTFLVTAEDYATLTQRNFSSLLKDITSFGGEDALEPEFGVVFLSLLFTDAIENDTLTSFNNKTRNQRRNCRFTQRFICCIF